MPNYFSHDYNSRSDPKIIELQIKHGQAGKGIYWDLVEMLYEQNGYLEISKIPTYAFALHTDNDTLNSIVREFELFKIKQDKFFSASVLRRIAQRNEKSEKAKESANARWSKVYADANALPTLSDSNAINKIKENKKKEKEIRKEQFINFWDLYDKKTDRAKCESKFLNLSDKEIELIFERVKTYVQNTPNVQYRKNPLSWLNGKCWNDESSNPVAPTQKEPELRNFFSYREYTQYCEMNGFTPKPQPTN